MMASAMAVTRPSGVSLASNNFQSFDTVVRSGAELPLYATGVLDTQRDEPVQLAIALNDVIVGTAESYRQDGGWGFAAMLADDGLREGPNDVRLFTIDEVEGNTALRPVASSDGQK
tara:strand:- start:847 stop:1194 length:348 start_codon:yes stop_codon:yes gene_type:complete